MKKYTGWLAIAALVLASACSGQDGEDGEDGGGTADMGTTGDMAESDGGGMDHDGMDHDGHMDHDGMASDTMSGDMADEDMGGGSTGYPWVVIYDGDGSEGWKPSCDTSGPGADLDMAALWRLNTDSNEYELIGVVKPDSIDYVVAPEASSCPAKTSHSQEDDVKAFAGAFGDVDMELDDGYLSLNGGSVEFQFGACSQSGATWKTCDGSGDAVEVMPGDEIDIYKVDAYYFKKGWSNYDAPTESYEVVLRTEKGLSDGSLSLGVHAGTQTLDEDEGLEPIKVPSE